MAKLEKKLEKKIKDNPKLEQRVLKDGRISLYLEYYLGRQSEPILDEFGEPVLYEKGKMAGKPKFKVTHLRKQETLPYHLIAKPRTPPEREENNRILELAKNIRFEREQEFKENRDGYRLKKKQDINFLDYFQGYINKYTKKDIRMIEIALHRFKDFLADTPEYNKYIKRITPQQINRDMVLTFTEYLQSRSVGEGAKSIYQRFKKVYKACATEYNFNYSKPFTKDDGKPISISIDDRQLRKEILSPEEMQQLASTHYDNENPNIRRAFLFCLLTGMRFCDVKDLTFGNVDYANRLLKFEQNKTKGHSANSGVVTPLNDGLLQLIGEPTEPGNRNELVFPLPSYEMCLKALKRWVKRAGINKHISWHCARHSFAVNILNNGANIKTVASLLGHSGLKHTEKYTRAVDSLKQQAIDSLPTLNI